jgi:hypothetical protein
VLTVADFSNTLTKGQIEEMASVDELEVVKEVQASWLAIAAWSRSGKDSGLLELQLTQHCRSILRIISRSTRRISRSPRRL